MSYFAVHYRYDPAADIEAVRPRHRDYLRTLAAEGHLKASGPYIDHAHYSALLIFQAADTTAVQAMVAADPVCLDGVLAEYSITEWNPLIGVFAE